MSESDLRPSEHHIRLARKAHDILVPAMREVARACGYALTEHGTVERDIDLVAVPWRDGAMGSGVARRRAGRHPGHLLDPREE